MFLRKYINEFYYNLVLDNYEISFLNTLDENNFVKIYNLLKEYNFYFIDDIILNYIEIFTLEYDNVKASIMKLKEKLGNDFVYIIGNNMNYLNEILEYEED